MGELVERFRRNSESYKSGHYNETQLRREFVDPFFEALGWDVSNKLGYSEVYKDVVHEDAIPVGDSIKAPDYCFRIGGSRKFFVEAKKPSVDIKNSPSPAYQLRRYAWSAGLPLSILTDFEEFAIFDCRFRPTPSDKPSSGRITGTFTMNIDEAIQAALVIKPGVAVPMHHLRRADRVRTVDDLLGEPRRAALRDLRVPGWAFGSRDQCDRERGSGAGCHAGAGGDGGCWVCSCCAGASPSAGPSRARRPGRLRAGGPSRRTSPSGPSPTEQPAPTPPRTPAAVPPWRPPPVGGMPAWRLRS